jgi:serine/threonine-protein kinase
VKQTASASTPEQKDRVVGTLPLANQTSAVTNVITVIVGSGPDSKPVPDVKGQTIETAQQIMTASEFLKTVPVPVDSPLPSGQVLGTDPPVGPPVPVDTVIQIQVSKGNQFVMPNVVGKFWVDAEPILRSLGWTGVLVPGADVQNSGQKTNAVVTQSPAAGSGVTFGSSITLSFAS